MQALHAWLEAQLPRVAGRSTLAEAIRYALSRWQGLTRFLHDGRIELDTNPVERAIRPVALGRKNHLFAGRTVAANVGRSLCSLIETCKLNGVEPYAYLTDVLTAHGRWISRSTASTNCCRGLGNRQKLSRRDGCAAAGRLRSVGRYDFTTPWLIARRETMFEITTQ